jgi:phage shock protein A
MEGEGEWVQDELEAAKETIYDLKEKVDELEGDIYGLENELKQVKKERDELRIIANVAKDIEMLRRRDEDIKFRRNRSY